MAELAPLTDADRRDIARQIGAMQSFALLGGPPGSSGPTLGASYPVDMLLLGLVLDGQPLRDAVKNTGRWHHQLDAARSSFARSDTEPTGEGLNAPGRAKRSGHAVNALVESKLASLIDETAAWIDSVDTASDVAHLLVAPAYNLTSIRLVGENGDRVVVVERPQRLAQLEMRRIYDGEEFLAILRDVHPVSGVPTRDV